MFRGGISTIQCVAASNFIYFYTFHGLKKWLSHESPTALTDLLYACCAGAVNVIITNPLWVVNTRIKMQHSSADGKTKLRRGLISKYISLLKGY